MKYIYKETKRLENPHKYMYTKYEGIDLIKSYQTDRMSVLKRLSTGSNDDPKHVVFDSFLNPFFAEFLGAQGVAARFSELMLYANQKENIIKKSPKVSEIVNFATSLPIFSDTESIVTLELLQSIIASQLMGLHELKVKVWLDRLVQRFEVTKKVYEVYPVGFRKGEGSSDAVILYWLLALSLSLFYAKHQSIKYLSTLLKTCDLLCSLPQAVMLGALSKHAMAAILSTEITSIEFLVSEKTIQNAI